MISNHVTHWRLDFSSGNSKNNKLPHDLNSSVDHQYKVNESNSELLCQTLNETESSIQVVCPGALDLPGPHQFEVRLMSSQGELLASLSSGPLEEPIFSLINLPQANAKYELQVIESIPSLLASNNNANKRKSQRLEFTTTINSIGTTTNNNNRQQEPDYFRARAGGLTGVLEPIQLVPANLSSLGSDVSNLLITRSTSSTNQLLLLPGVGRKRVAGGFDETGPNWQAASSSISSSKAQEDNNNNYTNSGGSLINGLRDWFLSGPAGFFSGGSKSQSNQQQPTSTLITNFNQMGSQLQSQSQSQSSTTNEISGFVSAATGKGSGGRRDWAPSTTSMTIASSSYFTDATHGFAALVVCLLMLLSLLSFLLLWGVRGNWIKKKRSEISENHQNNNHEICLDQHTSSNSNSSSSSSSPIKQHQLEQETSCSKDNHDLDSREATRSKIMLENYHPPLAVSSLELVPPNNQTSNILLAAASCSFMATPAAINSSNGLYTTYRRPLQGTTINTQNRKKIVSIPRSSSSLSQLMTDMTTTTNHQMNDHNFNHHPQNNHFQHPPSSLEMMVRRVKQQHQSCEQDMSNNQQQNITFNDPHDHDQHHYGHIPHTTEELLISNANLRPPIVGWQHQHQPDYQVGPIDFVHGSHVDDFEQLNSLSLSQMEAFAFAEQQQKLEQANGDINLEGEHDQVSLDQLELFINCTPTSTSESQDMCPSSFINNGMIKPSSHGRHLNTSGINNQFLSFDIGRNSSGKCAITNSNPLECLLQEATQNTSNNLEMIHHHHFHDHQINNNHPINSMKHNQRLLSSQVKSTTTFQANHMSTNSNSISTTLGSTPLAMAIGNQQHVTWATSGMGKQQEQKQGSNINQTPTGIMSSMMEHGLDSGLGSGSGSIAGSGHGTLGPLSSNNNNEIHFIRLLPKDNSSTTLASSTTHGRSTTASATTSNPAFELTLPMRSKQLSEAGQQDDLLDHHGIAANTTTAATGRSCGFELHQSQSSQSSQAYDQRLFSSSPFGTNTNTSMTNTTISPQSEAHIQSQMANLIEQRTRKHQLNNEEGSKSHLKIAMSNNKHQESKQITTKQQEDCTCNHE